MRAKMIGGKRPLLRENLANTSPSYSRHISQALDMSTQTCYCELTWLACVWFLVPRGASLLRERLQWVL